MTVRIGAVEICIILNYRVFFRPAVMCWCCLQDSGALLCVIDDSNEHMLSVWDCNKGTKHAEVKVKDSQSTTKS